MAAPELLSPDAPLTQKQIAERLGVSRQLVGFALRGDGRVSEETRLRILEFAQANGYDQFANREARVMASLRNGKRIATHCIAVLFLSTFEDQPLSNVPFFVPFFQGLEAEANERGLDLMLCPIRPDALPRLVRERQVDGVVCLLAPHEVSQQIQGLALPVINILSDVKEVSCLLADDADGIAQIVRHLSELGHRHIGYLGYDAPSGARRLQSLQNCLQFHELPFSEALIDATLPAPTKAAGAEATRKLLEREDASRLTALVCYNDLVAMGAIEVLQEKGIRVPEDVSVTGFDDVSGEYNFRPSLSSVRFARQRLGRRAISLLCEDAARIREEFAPLREVFPTEFIPRESTDRPQQRAY